MFHLFQDKTILITGGSGSLGTAICQELAEPDLNPAKVIIYSRDTHKQAKLASALGRPEWLRCFIGDVRDKERLIEATKGVDIVIHAAAIKSIVECEYNPVETVLTNIIGTANTINAAIANHVSKVLVISTDKACSPANLYGNTKAVAERIAIEKNTGHLTQATKISVARYGNVAGSAGSVIPLFKEQLKLYKPFTVTDKRMTRFWITMNQAVKLIFNCLNNMQGGEIFVPKIPSAKIVDIARALMSDHPIKEIGIRPGEKLHETLITKQEARRSIDLVGHYIIEPEFDFWESEFIAGNRPMEGWYYSSDRNVDWLSVEDIRGML